MGQRTRILTQIAGFRGWKVAETRWENEAGQTIEPFADYVPADAILVLVVARRWAARCPKCLAICSGSPHENCKTRQWADLPWAGHRPPTGRIEALNNNWGTLVRRARGYRDHEYLLAKLRFITANPVANDEGIPRFLALGLPPPVPAVVLQAA